MNGEGRRSRTLRSSLLGWLRPRRSRGDTFADVAQLREAVMAAFLEQPRVSSVVADLEHDARFTVEIDGKASTEDLGEMFDYLRAYPEDPVLTIGNFVGARVRGRRPVEDGDVVAVVRTRDYLGDALSGPDPVLHEDLGADLVVLYMADRPDSMYPITAADLPGRTLAEVRALALGNVRKWLPKVVTDDSLTGGALFFVEDNTLLSTSLLLLEAFWGSIAGRFPGDVLIAIPRRDQLFIFTDDGRPSTRDGIHRLIQATFEEDFNLLSPRLYARRGGRIMICD